MFQHIFSAKAEDTSFTESVFGKLFDACAHFSASSSRRLGSILSSLNLLQVLWISQNPSSLLPYAQPSGLSDDITQWLSIAGNSQIATCKSKMFTNINVDGAARGTVMASTSTQNPDYHYNWVRDAALTMNVVVKLYGAASDPTRTSTYEQILFQYAQARADEQNDPNLQAGLGEPKFELNNTVFTGPWGRPQNDGPAESATTLLEFAYMYLAKGGDLTTVQEKIWNSEGFEKQAPVLKDLLFVAANWSTQSFDLWEEESGDHFFNRIVSYRALSTGARFVADLNDTDTTSTLSIAARAVQGSLPGFWDEQKQLIVYEAGPVLMNKTSYRDISVVLGVLHAYNDEKNFGYTDDRVLATAYQIAIGFLAIYPIANVTTDSSGAVLGIPIGRYPEDVYNGTGTAPNGGNPWFLATTSMAELFYRAAVEFRSNGTLVASATSLAFWQYFAPKATLTAGQTYTSSDPQFEQAISAIEGWADAFIRRIKYHTPSDQRLAEEYNRNDGISTGALDLTWSYASLLSAAFARATLRRDTGYITAVADLP